MSAGRHGDPTAGMAKANLESTERKGALVFPGPDGPTEIWLSEQLARQLVRLLNIKQTPGGDLFAVLKENALDTAPTAEGKNQNTYEEN